MTDNPSDLLYAPHGEPGRFFSPWQPFNTGFKDVLKWQLSKKGFDKSAPVQVPVVPNDGAYLVSKG